ncbi:MAG: transglutaminase domain-containing protein [Polyangiales bacterium]
MRRATGFLLTALALGLPGAAQSPDPRLHRFIPGDLDFGELPAGALTAPQNAEDFRRLASGTGWDDRGAAASSGDVIRPQGNWESIARTMDDQTRSPPGATLRYREVFTPSVAPFKRTHAYDAVDDLGRLVLRDPSARPLTVGEVPASWSREPLARFTGDVMIELSAGAPTIVPSVAGEQAVLSFRTEPEVPLAFAQDSAGNLYARAPEARTVRLIYVLAAPQHAFAAPGARLPSLPPGGASFHGLAPKPAVPTFLEAAVEPVLRRVGVRRTDPFPRVLDALVGYFRAFRDDDLAGPTDRTLYSRLALGGVGACRHRAYAFVLTLHALGVPARYVGNEAHAWAEVAIPGVGWSRVDLGGWDVNFRDESAERERFVPDNPDPFQRPDAYRNGYSTQTATGDGSRRRHRDGGAVEPDAAADPQATQPGAENGAPGENPGASGTGSASGTAGGSSAGASGANGVGTNGAGANGASGVAGAAARSGAQRTTDRAEDPVADEPPPEERHATVLRLLSVRSSDGAAGRGVVRGTLVVCEGEARDETGAAVPDLPVTLELLRDRHVLTVVRDGRRDTALGTTVTDANGRFHARVLLPLDLEAGAYSIRAQTSGDARHRAASFE